jgi:hypothetical protein
MNLSHAISRRFTTTGGLDPDTLHGLLYAIEDHKITERFAARTMGIPATNVVKALDRARAGGMERVPACYGDAREVREPLPEGLFPHKWKRSLIALMLAAGGTHTAEIEASLQADARFSDPARAVRDIREDLKAFDVKVTANRIEGTFAFRYRITGNDAWRMQKIIANGWAL